MISKLTGTTKESQLKQENELILGMYFIVILIIYIEK